MKYIEKLISGIENNNIILIGILSVVLIAAIIFATRFKQSY